MKMDKLKKFRIKVAVKWAASIILSIWLIASCGCEVPGGIMLGFLIIWAGGELLEGVLGLFGIAGGDGSTALGAINLVIAPFKGIVNIVVDTMKAINGNVE